MRRRFEQIGARNYPAGVGEAGELELLHQHVEYNDMAEQLVLPTSRDHLLTERLARLQQELRADLPRHLDDELGLRLFAVNLDCEPIAQLSKAGGDVAIQERLREIRSVGQYAQRQVRNQLGCPHLVLNPRRPGPGLIGMREQAGRSLTYRPKAKGLGSTVTAHLRPPPADTCSRDTRFKALPDENPLS
jgi:hypothetical protein